MFPVFFLALVRESKLSRTSARTRRKIEFVERVGKMGLTWLRLVRLNRNSSGKTNFSSPSYENNYYVSKVFLLNHRKENRCANESFCRNRQNIYLESLVV